MGCCAPAGRLPLSVADLSTGEQLLLWAIRTRVEGRDRLGKVQEAFALAAHPHPGSVFACFEPWFLVLSSHARRDLLLHRAPCRCVSADELAMVQLVATQQAGAPARSAELAHDLVEPGMVDALLGRRAPSQQRSGGWAWSCRSAGRCSGHHRRRPSSTERRAGLPWLRRRPAARARR